MIGRIKILIVSTLLFTHTCHCGDEERVVERQPLPCDDADPPELPHAQPSGHNEQAEDSGFILDLSYPNSRIHRSFHYNSDDNHIRLIIPEDDARIRKVVSGQEEVWIPGRGEKFEYAKVFLKNRVPSLVFIVKSKNTATWKWYVKTGNKWKECGRTYNNEMYKLRIPVEKKEDFALEINDSQDTDKCRIFETKILGSPIKLYFPKPGYHVQEVKDTETTIWKASEGTDERCVSCNLFSEYGKPSFFLLKVREKNLLRLVYFEKENNGRWSYINSNQFNKRLSKIRTMHPTSGYLFEDIVANGKSESRVSDPNSAKNPITWLTGCIDAIRAGIPSPTSHRLLWNPPGFGGGYKVESADCEGEREAKSNQPVQGVTWKQVDDSHADSQDVEEKEKND
ncbi:signal peptide containing protein [Theileria equi strain WA]|uniref:Signal peptide containing protein n=1 Tax=Theileria equi strain WA TaxID=1537102 RepID=L1L9R4_THEEQ|nr:signal peptide containing protein [Theileria equi strain WA]EKX72236.1 signal peptide containing protein [Theileria equi strain WA]|eukprot:XP_004831688.1 signal peptide containing protein [Theileria equi strain WA]